MEIFALVRPEEQQGPMGQSLPDFCRVCEEVIDRSAGAILGEVLKQDTVVPIDYLLEGRLR